MKFDKITKEHIESVAMRLRPEDVPAIKSARKYSVAVNGIDWPVKFIIQEAYKDAYGQSIGHDQFVSTDARKHLEKLNYTVKENGFQNFDRNVPLLIEGYINKVRNDGNGEELYKWELVKQNEGKPDLSAADFNAEIRSMEFKNLVYGVGIGAIRHLARDRAAQYKKLLEDLYNESIDLQERIDRFSTGIELLYREIVPDARLSHHHDERTIATLLTYKYPDRYTFFKDSFYQKLCALLKQSSKPKQQKYVHYLSIIEDIIERYIRESSDLLALKEDFLNANCYPDHYHTILAQDILYRQLDNNIEEINLEKHALYKISMGELKKDFDVCLDEQVIVVHSETGALASSKESQADVFRTMNTGDYFYLTNGNTQGGVTLIGRVISATEPASATNLAEQGYIQRRYEPVVYSVKRTRYNADKAWWAPNHPSTCVQIKHDDLIRANKSLFSPYFQVEFTTKVAESEPKIMQIQKPKKQPPLNTILFGPPGTGKTYTTIRKAIELFEGKEAAANLDREVLKSKYMEYEKIGRIRFVTFHQSMSYEDFVEGIKPVTDLESEDKIRYVIQPGIFKTMAIEASLSVLKGTGKSEVSKASRFEAIFERFFEWVQSELEKKGDLSIQGKSGNSLSIVTANENQNFQLRHAGGEVKYVVSKNRLSKLYAAIDDLDQISNFNIFSREIIGGSNASAYWAVLNAMRGHEKSGDDNFELETLDFENKERLVGETDWQKVDPNAGEPYLLIIDEINRGNVSQIFGELITLLEPDKRLSMAEALRVTLPYSKSRFGVPANLYVLGTMNTADRSIEALDTALRRRFAFTEISPNYDLLSTGALFYRLWHSFEPIGFGGKWKEAETAFFQLYEGGIAGERKIYEALDSGDRDKFIADIMSGDIVVFKGIEMRSILERINSRIEAMLSRDHLIGHSYFMNVFSMEAFIDTMYKNIIPLLQEYFYGDYRKIGMVLGAGFIKSKKASSELFAKFEGAEDFEEKELYEIVDYRQIKGDYVIKVDGQMQAMDFKKAINLLLN